ncbi:MAG: hypothetical protein AB7H90_14165 [Alphaproteobacteria bacterium]
MREGVRRRAGIAVLSSVALLSLLIEARSDPFVLDGYYSGIFDGEYTGTTTIGSYLHTETDTVINLDAWGLHRFIGPTEGAFSWSGKITVDTPSSGTLVGSGLIANAGERSFTIESGGVYQSAPTTLTLYWGGTDPKFGPIGGAADLRASLTGRYISADVAKARDQLAAAGVANPTNLKIAQTAMSLAIGMREQSAVTSLDPNLRDAEYVLRGYIGGQLLTHPWEYGGDPNDLPNLGGAGAWALYSAIKWYNIWSGHPERNQSTDLPATPPFTGGMANALGYWLGLKQTSVDQLGAAYGLKDLSLPDMPTDPVTPENETVPTDLVPLENQSLSSYFFQQDGQSLTYLDPGKITVFSSALDPFSSLLVPASGGAPSTLTLAVNDLRVPVQLDTLIDFSQFGPDPYTFALIDESNTSSSSRYTVGVGFSKPGPEYVASMEFPLQPTSVPEPGTFEVLLAALAGLAVLRSGRVARAS